MDRILLVYGHVVMPVLVSLAIYYLTTLSLWAGHWFSHLDGSPLRVFHLSGHHTLYPHSRAMRSAAFRYGSGWASSIYALLPWLLVQLLIEYMVLALWPLMICVLETTLIVISLNYLHTQFHLHDPWLAQFRWFREARARHEPHHDRDVNFMVGDHFWDRRFRTYQSAIVTKASAHGASEAGSHCYKHARAGQSALHWRFTVGRFALRTIYRIAVLPTWARRTRSSPDGSRSSPTG